MSKLLLLQNENIPCWYEIGFDFKEVAIIVRTHVDYLEFIQPLTEECHLVKSFMEEFGFSTFEGSILNGNFGFNGSFKRTGLEGDFIAFSISIPPIEIVHLQTCDLCQGHKTDLLFKGGDCSKCRGSGQISKMTVCSFCRAEQEYGRQEDCGFCKGTGQEVESHTDWQTFHAISATFSVFFDLMWFGCDAEKIVACKFPQLMSINTLTAKGQHGGSLDGVYSIPLVNWLAGFPGRTTLIPLEDAMKATWQKIHSKFYDMDKLNTWARVSRPDGWLSINCPGDRAGLYPNDSMGITKGRGTGFSCHNVDTPMQQLTLLSALGALHDMAKKDIK